MRALSARRHLPQRWNLLTIEPDNPPATPHAAHEHSMACRTATTTPALLVQLET